MPLFIGACTAMVTPFTQDGVNYDALGETIEFQLREGIDALLACGTTGEPPAMTKDEKRDVVRYTIEKTAKRVPVIAGTGGNNTAEVIRASQEAEMLGADALLVVTPYYNKTNPKGLIAHFKAVAEAVTLPIIIYNVPSRTAMNVSPAALLELSKIKNITAMKEASGDLAQVLEMYRLCGDSIDLYSGNDDVVVPLLSVGGKGVISVVSNIAPKDTRTMVASFLQGRVQEALTLQLKLKPLIDALFCEVNPIPVKTAMNLMGFSMGPLRLPLTDMSDANLARLKTSLQEYGLI